MTAGRFTFVFTERELSMLAEACERAADHGDGEFFTADEYARIGEVLDARLQW